jgi:hypothetical protein
MKRRATRGLDYYVHYMGGAHWGFGGLIKLEDRRHDEWVPESAVGPTILETSEEESDDGRGKRLSRKSSITHLEAKQEELEKERVELTKVKSIEYARFGNVDLKCWYFSPYPGNVFIYVF